MGNMILTDQIKVDIADEFKEMVYNCKVYDLKSSIMASGYPMNTDISEDPSVTAVTPKDESRAKKLGAMQSASGEDNYLCGIRVSLDVKFSNKVWVEAERYHFLDIVSSQSTMHRAGKMLVNSCTDDMFSDYTDTRIVDVVMELAKEAREDPTNKEKQLRLLYSIPSGFKLRARISLNYRQLKTIYRQRVHHRLPEWRLFCKFIETLPYAKELITGADIQGDEV